MIKKAFATALLVAALSPAVVVAQPAPTPVATPAPNVPSVSVTAAAPAAGAYTTADTDIGTLLDDPAAKAILDKHMPGFSANPQIDMARSMTLKAIQGYVPDQITDEALAKIDADLAQLPGKK